MLKFWSLGAVVSGFGAAVGALAISAQDLTSSITPEQMVIPVSVVVVLFIGTITATFKVVKILEEARYAFKRLRERVEALECNSPCPLLRHHEKREEVE